eukprot:TRINITY_DN61185_c0_g1_i1.p1 TRINITY_DN61185_c0_g1~~TRINITY_DN61185_c0_g1_i1.p1  ORF type:complete len:393 (-),score=49.23 TRINITY_DN61185_c0_g1_i1:126-1304(-)
MAWPGGPVAGPPVRGAYQTVEGGFCDECIAADGEEKGSWEYVGKGRGAFSPSTDLQYVGEGRGEYDFAKPRAFGVKIWCGLVLCFLVVLVIILDVLFTRFLFRKPVERDVVTVQVTQPPDRYHCFQGDATNFHYNAELAATWSAAHQSWCCEHKGVACPTAPPPTQPPTLPPTTTGQPTTWILVPVPATNPAFMSPNIVHMNFHDENCQVGSYEQWSLAKQQFCCTHAEICGPPTTAPPVMEFNCAVSQGNDPSLWLETKRTWCCVHHNTGCTTTLAPVSEQCTQGNLLGWRNAVEQQYCCTTHGLGCTTAAPIVVTTPEPQLFDCTAGFTNWEVNWSDTRKLWCCTHFQRGCHQSDAATDEHSCSGYSELWTAGERLWCCRHKGKGCSNTS